VWPWFAGLFRASAATISYSLYAIDSATRLSSVCCEAFPQCHAGAKQTPPSGRIQKASTLLETW
jgi:hypothetical protein